MRIRFERQKCGVSESCATLIPFYDNMRGHSTRTFVSFLYHIRIFYEIADFFDICNFSDNHHIGTILVQMFVFSSLQEKCVKKCQSSNVLTFVTSRTKNIKIERISEND